MRDLAENFEGRGEVKGYSFTQMQKSNKAYLYHVSNNEGGFHYEVFRRKENTRFGVVSYPSSKAFGVWAWTTGDFESAKKRFAQLHD